MLLKADDNHQPTNITWSHTIAPYLDSRFLSASTLAFLKFLCLTCKVWGKSAKSFFTNILYVKIVGFKFDKGQKRVFNLKRSLFSIINVGMYSMRISLLTALPDKTLIIRCCLQNLNASTLNLKTSILLVGETLRPLLNTDVSWIGFDQTCFILLYPTVFSCACLRGKKCFDDFTRSSRLLASDDSQSLGGSCYFYSEEPTHRRSYHQLGY